MAVHPNSLANLRPAMRGEVRKPAGANQYSLSLERNYRLDATCRALLECEDPDLKQQLLGRVAQDVVAGAIAGDRRLLARLLDGGTKGWW